MSQQSVASKVGKVIMGPPATPQPVTHVRTGPLSASQHILHLLLTVFTGGLWAPVWIICAMRGNRKATW